MAEIKEFRVRDQATDAMGDLLQLMNEDNSDMLRQMRLRIERVIDAAETTGGRSMRRELIRAYSEMLDGVVITDERAEVIARRIDELEAKWQRGGG